MDDYFVLSERPLERLFRLGELYITAQAQEVILNRDVNEALDRHAHGDWGELPDADREANELALKQGGRLLSSYHDRYGQRFWIITEADYNATTVLLPDDY